MLDSELASNPPGRYARWAAAAAEALTSAVAGRAAAEMLPVIDVGLARAGEAARSSVGVVNEAPNGPAVFGLVVTDLLGPEGAPIPAPRVSLLPSALELATGEAAEVSISVDVPAGARPGAYVGLIQAVGLEYLRAIVRVQVEAGT